MLPAQMRTNATDERVVTWLYRIVWILVFLFIVQAVIALALCGILLVIIINKDTISSTSSAMNSLKEISANINHDYQVMREPFVPVDGLAAIRSQTEPTSLPETLRALIMGAMPMARDAEDAERRALAILERFEAISNNFIAGMASAFAGNAAMHNAAAPIAHHTGSGPYRVPDA